MKRILIILVALVFVVAIGGVVSFRFMLHNFLKSDDCQKRVEAAASARLGGAETTIAPLQPHSLEMIYTDRFEAKNGPAFTLLRADQIRANVDFAFFERRCTVSLMEVARFRVDLKALPNPAHSSAQVTEGAEVPKETPGGFDFDVEKVVVEDFGGSFSGANLKGVRVEAVSNPGASEEWIINGKGGSLVPPLGPEWKMDGVEARFRQNTLFISAARLSLDGKGSVQVEGAFGPAATGTRSATFSNISVAHLLPEDWRARLTGNLKGLLSSSAEGSSRQWKGDVSLSDGVLTALPVLDKVATVTRLDVFRRLPLHKASAKLEETLEGNLVVRDLEIESRGLVRVTGALTIRDGRAEGTLQLGVVPAVLEWVPGARNQIFTSDRDGFLWTPVKISGPIDHLEEDLTPRLMTAVVSESINAAKEGVRENAKGVIEALSPLLPVDVKSLPIPGF